MTIKKIKSSDILGDNYYIYNLTSSNYTPNLNGSITITCTVKNIYGDVIANKSIQLYQNDTAVGNATTTNNNGVATWTITCSTAGIQKFSVKDTVIEVFVDTTSKTGHNHTTSDITNFPEIPTKTSDLTNDSNFLTSHQSLANYIQKSNTNGLIKNDGTIDTNTYLTTHQDISDKVNTSDLGETAFSNDYNDLDNLPTIPTAYTHPSTHPATMITGLSTVATSGSYNDLSNKPSIPTKTSDLTNDSGYLTSHQDISGKANTADLGEVAFSNDYEDLDNLPTIPSAYTHPTTHPSSMITDSNTHSNIGNTTNTLENIITNIDTKLGSLANVDLIEVTSSLGTASANTMNKLYLVAETTGATNDNYEVFVTVRTGTSGNYSYSWEKVDTARIDLSNYLTTTNAQQTYVAKESGKGLSSNDYTTTEKNKLAGLHTVATSGNYNDLSNKPTSMTPTSHTHGYITNSGELTSTISSNTNIGNVVVTNAKTDKLETVAQLPYSKISGTPSLANIATSGSYNDLTNKPSFTQDSNISSSSTESYPIGTLNISGSDITIYGKDTNTVYEHPIPPTLGGVKTYGLYKTTIDAKGHIINVGNVEASDLPSHTHTISNVTNLQSTLNGKANTSDLGNLAYEDDVDLTTHDVSELTDTNDTAFTPKTHTHGNLQNNGQVGTSNNASKNVVTDSNGYITTEAKPTIDTTITSGGSNAVTSGAIYSALQNKQNNLSSLSYAEDENGNAIFEANGDYFYGINNRIYHDVEDTNELHFLDSNDIDVNFDDIIIEGDSRLTNARTPTSHTHSISDVTALQTSLNGKASSTHSHSISEVTNLQSSLNNKIEESDLLDLIYPIGSIYMEKSTNAHSICPIQTTLGGTWTRIENRFLYASESGQGVGTTDGSETVTLTENQMPSHNHTQTSHNHAPSSGGSYKFVVATGNIAAGSKARKLPDTQTNGYYFVVNDAGVIIGENTTTNSKQPEIQNKGGGEAHDNMPPYIIVNVWERTA